MFQGNCNSIKLSTVREGGATEVVGFIPGNISRQLVDRNLVFQRSESELGIVEYVKTVFSLNEDRNLVIASVQKYSSVPFGPLNETEIQSTRVLKRIVKK